MIPSGAPKVRIVTRPPGGATASHITTEKGLVQIDVIDSRDRQLSLEEIGRVPIRTNDDRIVHIEHVAKFKYEAAPAILTREDRADVVRDFRSRVDRIHFSDNVKVDASVQKSATLMNEALSSLAIGSPVRSCWCIS